MAFSLHIACSILFFSLSYSVSSLNSDGFSLLALKEAITFDPHHSLSSWKESDRTPCSWAGISCSSGRVSEISLPNKGLAGYIPSELGFLLSLRHLSLRNNNFSNPIPSGLFSTSSLISLDLSLNFLSGKISPEIKVLKNLTHLDLSSNLLNGSLPGALTELTSLSGSLNLSYNHFSGQVPESFGKFRVSVSLDLRHNNLSGPIPQFGSLLNQGPTAFMGNPYLCGFPLQNPCPSPENTKAPLNPLNLKDPGTLNPSFDNPTSSQNDSKKALLMPILCGVVFIAGSLVASVWIFRKKWAFTEGKTEKERNRIDIGCEREEGLNGEFHVLDEGFKLELEELLRASAHVVGKSRIGIVYKVVVGKGISVAVRRLSEGSGGLSLSLKEFEAEVEAIARASHPNIVRLRAYYYASDEKLLVSDYISNGTLRSALHGGSVSSSPALAWAVRLNIAQGAARGLAYIHESGPRKYVHGNVKSSKILLDEDFQPYVSGFGIGRLVYSTFKASDSFSGKQNATPFMSSSSACYLAPEIRGLELRPTQKCDVYAFGIVLLEILTGRLPDPQSESNDGELEVFVRQAFKEERPLSEIVDRSLLHEVYAKKQVLAVFHIALGCTEAKPEMRPRMRAVSDCLGRVGCH
ncbi:receptor protein kinase-like protein ZAR1 [Aristolochia californica]|uniref:receptor protein kinase-like protein ZAR1 n=1 Tax=Aristolochia californica TaxID=171875 RepID=UPI0035D55EAA